MNRRLIIFKNTILEKTFGGSLLHWILNLLSPSCSILSSFKIKNILKEENFQIIYFSNIEHPIFLSKNIPLHSIYQVIAEQFYKWHWHNYQIPQTQVEINDVVFDCGCAEGIFPLMIYNKCSKVYSFEPLEDYQIGLNKTFAKIQNVFIINEALGDKVGSIGFAKSGIQSSIANNDNEGNVIVKINTIDNFCTSNNCVVNYIKADIEGYELQLLKGASDSIKKFKPKIAITVYHLENDYNVIKDFILNIVPDYNFIIKGISDLDNHPVMLHAWVN